jgi:hypothetical protein
MFLVIIAVVGFIFGLAFLGDGEVLVGLLIMAAGWYLGKYAVSRMKINAAKVAEWEALVGNSEYKYPSKNPSIALDTQKELLHLKSFGKSKTYPFSDIRSWRYNLSTGGNITPIGNVGLAGAIQASAANASNNSRNRANSGFFVTVKDIDNPEWQIPMYSEKEMKRWMEIFEQKVNNN